MNNRLSRIINEIGDLDCKVTAISEFETKIELPDGVHGKQVTKAIIRSLSEKFNESHIIVFFQNQVELNRLVMFSNEKTIVQVVVEGKAYGIEVVSKGYSIFHNAEMLGFIFKSPQPDGVWYLQIDEALAFKFMHEIKSLGL